MAEWTWCRFLLVASLGMPVGLAAFGAGAFDPVDYRGAGATIRLSRLSTYDSGYFASSTAEVPPAYDASKRRLYYINKSRNRIDVLDLDDPSFLHRDQSIDLGPTSQAAEAVAFRSGVLAIAFAGPTKSSPGVVTFLNRDGRPEAPPVTVGPQPTMLVFTPDGKKLLVPGQGEASGDYRDDPEGTVTVIDWCDSFPCSHLDSKRIDFSAFNGRKAELIRKGVRIYGPNASVAQDIEPESITVSPDSRTAWVTLERNNAIGVIDLVDKRVTDILPLGFKNNALPGKGLDASDRDGRVRIRTWRLRSWYEPDYLATFTTAAGTFLVTANEGDPRDFSGYTEVARVADLPLDPAVFANAAWLRQPRNLGRLQVSRFDGRNARGLFSALYAFGGRSLSVWTTRAELMADTGDAFERITAAAVPAFFNASDTSNGLDQTSPGRGPEPEALTVGMIGGRSYVFVGFERIGGVMVYDVTDPRRPHFEQYINNRNFAVDPATACVEDKPKSPLCAAAGDLSVEGLLFIPAGSSPTGIPLLVVSHETSNSVTVFRVDPST
ncbi:MAG: choice-of-anchor I family protein [Geminicoccaceae bacterium]